MGLPDAERVANCISSYFDDAPSCCVCVIKGRMKKKRGQEGELLFRSRLIVFNSPSLKFDTFFPPGNGTHDAYAVAIIVRCHFYTRYFLAWLFVCWLVGRYIPFVVQL